MVRRLLSSLSFDKVAVGGTVACVLFQIGSAFVEGNQDLFGSILCSSLPHYAPCSALFSPWHIRSLETHGFVVIDHVLSHSELRAAIDDAINLLPKKELTLVQETDDDLYRSDSVRFFGHNDRNEAAAAESYEGKGLLHAQRLLRGVGSELQNKASGGESESVFVGFKNVKVRRNTQEKTHIKEFHPPKDSAVDLHLLSVPDLVQLAHYQGHRDRGVDGGSCDMRRRLLAGAESGAESTGVGEIRGSLYKPHRDGIGGGAEGLGQSGTSPAYVSTSYPSSSSSSSSYDNPSATHPFGQGLLNYLRLTVFRKRFLTAILYLNDTEVAQANSESFRATDESWQDCDGGMLRLYLGADGDDTCGTSAKTIMDIAPRGGRLVLMDSKEVLHEVTPTDRDRLALTVWFTL
jgi:hypothetical protein